MKRTKIAMAGALLLAIGSAFVTRAPDKLQNVGFTQLAGECRQITTPCNTSGSIACGATVYSSKSNNTTCALPLLTQKNP